MKCMKMIVSHVCMVNAKDLLMKLQALVSQRTGWCAMPSVVVLHWRLA